MEASGSTQVAGAPKALIAREVEALRDQMFQQFGGAAGKDLTSSPAAG